MPVSSIRLVEVPLRARGELLGIQGHRAQTQDVLDRGGMS